MEDPILSDARDWLAANPSESIAAASRIFKVKKSTLQSSITRLNRKRVGRRGQNKLLTATQIKAIKEWITTQYWQGLGATKQMTFAAISHILQPKPPPSASWLTKLTKNELSDFHTIKTKPISQHRVDAKDEIMLEEWFSEYYDFVNTHNIEPSSIWNIDETGFQIGIPGGEEVIVPCGVTELYTGSLENRTFITVVEAVSASGVTTPPILIVPDIVHIEAWYHRSLVGTEQILLSKSGYKNDELAIEWLNHFISYTESTPSSTTKLLLLGSHSSHRTPEFTILAAEHNILTYAFPSQLTHVLQPLDVRVFQPYKHWHREAVFDLEYNLRSFM